MAPITTFVAISDIFKIKITLIMSGEIIMMLLVILRIFLSLMMSMLLITMFEVLLKVGLEERQH